MNDKIQKTGSEVNTWKYISLSLYIYIVGKTASSSSGSNSGPQDRISTQTLRKKLFTDLPALMS